MRARGVRTNVTLFINGGAGAWVQPLAEYDRVVVHLGSADASVHLDRDAIVLLSGVLVQAREALDVAQDKMAAAIDAQLSAERMSA